MDLLQQVLIAIPFFAMISCLIFLLMTLVYEVVTENMSHHVYAHFSDLPKLLTMLIAGLMIIWYFNQITT